MPSSRPNIIPTVIHLLQQLKPQSILDVGVGFGKWGHLFREYTDINEAENEPGRYQRPNWKIRIEGVEGNPAYLTDLHRFVYNEIHIGDACELMAKLSSYDLIFAGDVIEHFDKDKGFEFLQNAIARANKAVIISTPKFDTEQSDLCGNELERHRSLWKAKDFERFGATVKAIDRDTLLAVIPKPGVPTLRCTPPMLPSRAELRRFKRVKEGLSTLIPAAEPFILVDEDQLRGELPHTNALPFLEKDGLYWGPPSDDATGIFELERMRKGGARYIAFTWPAFWWLGHYADLAKYLRANYSCVREDDSLIVFQLAK